VNDFSTTRALARSLTYIHTRDGIRANNNNDDNNDTETIASLLIFIGATRADLPADPLTPARPSSIVEWDVIYCRVPTRSSCRNYHGIIMDRHYRDSRRDDNRAIVAALL